MCLRYGKQRVRFSFSTVNEIAMENRKQALDFYFPFCFVKSVTVITTPVDHKKSFSVWHLAVTLETGFWMLAKLYHRQNQAANFFWILQKSISDLNFQVPVTLNSITALQCWISVWEQLEWSQSPLLWWTSPGLLHKFHTASDICVRAWEQG